MKRKNAEKETLDRSRGKSRFIYQQLAEFLRKMIEEGGLKPGDALPSMDILAEQHQVNKATVRQALAELTARGLVYSIPAKGTFVAEPARRREIDTAKRSLSIGWVSRVSGHSKTGRYHTELMDALRHALTDIRGHLSVLTTGHLDPAAFCKIVGEAHLDGAILVGPFFNEPIKMLADSGLPCVLIDDLCRGGRIDSILLDNRLGGYQAVAHLLSLGHRKLAFIAGPSDWKITQDRLAGAMEAVTEAGLSQDDVLVIPSDFSPEGGQTAFTEILKRKQLPTAVFCMNDEMAAGALHALYEHSHLRVPQDISLIGFDDISWTTMTHPPLTTVHVDRERMAKEAVERLQSAMMEKDHLPLTTLLATRVVVRKSTAPAKP